MGCNENEEAAGSCCSGGSCSAGQPKKATSKAQEEAMIKKLGQQLMTMQTNNKSIPKSEDEAKHRNYQFWSTQPVPSFSTDTQGKNGPIEEDKPQSEVRQEPFSLIKGFEWSNVDLNNPKEQQELYQLLNENYVEDDDNMFRFDYSAAFLKWALRPPGWRAEWACGVRVSSNKKLVAFISAIPATIEIHGKEKHIVEINFLCVHKKMRSKRVAPVLIREITRRVNATGIFQAVYTAGVVLPKPIATCRYWHRSLNPKKLINVQFASLSKNMTMQRTIKLYKLPEQPRSPGFKILEKCHMERACNNLNEYLAKYKLHQRFTLEEFEHWFLPRKDIVYSYVVESPTGDVTDFISFYSLSSTIMNHPQYKSLYAAYCFYYFNGSMPLKDLMYDTLIMAKKNNFDVFNALDLMENKPILDDLKFGMGDGNLHYYIFNWVCPNIEPSQVGLVLQ
ncbi:hypothetical protein ACHWQZ_G007302 [Mnemiopsis leidyi]